MNTKACWCGNAKLESFSDAYLACPRCGTLVVAKPHGPEISRVSDNDKGLYGREYWFSHQEKDLGFGNILTRARTDLSERCLHWLRTILKYRLPPARTLELGSGHGGFVLLLKQLGFDSAGLELSPWVVNFSQRIFKVPVLFGPVEQQPIEPGSLDMIAMMDVLEHLPDPVGTVGRCLSVLKPDGILVVQTPCFPKERSYSELVEKEDRFLEMLQEDEHLYLFSKDSVREFFARLGAEHLVFEPAIFASYDMFLVASRHRLAENTQERIEEHLSATPEGRIVQALLDLDGRNRQLSSRLQESEIDRAARLDQINELTRRLQESDADRTARGEQIQSLTAMVHESQGDRTALHVLIKYLTGNTRESAVDRAARAEQVKSLTAMVRQLEADRISLDEQIKSLAANVRESEADRSALREQIDSLKKELKSLLSRSSKFIDWPEIQNLKKGLGLTDE